MSTHLLIAVLAVLAFPSCTLRDAGPDDKTFAEIVATVRAAPAWAWGWWMACVGLGPFVQTLWYAARYALYLASHIVAKAAAWLASFASMDGNDVRLYRTCKIRGAIRA